MKRLVIARAAVLDVIAHSQFLAQDSESAAKRFEDEFESCCQMLGEFPGIGAKTLTINPRLSGARRFAIRGFPNHLVFYRETSRHVRVLRVLHAARNIDQLKD